MVILMFLNVFPHQIVNSNNIKTFEMTADEILTPRSESFWSEHMFRVDARMLEACRKQTWHLWAAQWKTR